MTRKDYIKLADLLKENRQAWNQSSVALEAIDDIERGLCVILAEDNSNFDRQRFIDAAGGQS